MELGSLQSGETVTFMIRVDLPTPVYSILYQDARRKRTTYMYVELPIFSCYRLTQAR